MSGILVLATFIFSLIFTLAVKKLALKTGFVDSPSGSLKNHSRPVPYAGAGIFIAVIFAMLALRLFTSYPTGTLRQLRGIVLGGGFIFLVGVVDDFYDLDYKLKFAAQAVSALVLVHYGIYIKIFSFPWLNIVFSVLWVLLIINSINIIDILDGLAPGVSALAALGFFMVTLPEELIYVNAGSIILFGALAGFWVLNKPPAKVFMGDAGSLFTGFMLAALSMGARYSSENLLGLFAPVLILLVPLYDTFLVMYFRWRAGKPLFKGSKDHYAIRLSTAGFSKWQINLISYATAFVLSCAAFLITIVPGGAAFFILAVVFTLALAGSAALGTINPHIAP
ncbi:MAG: MraY family glycosyltransferase [Elusimicrobiota bacterium]